ncbi:hypothetical protein C8R48DRAFT_188134 [Suillus tomentosus]|nr:hypothetical protein C8R48DRAFT_188134 [Suillus tomentosus]
MSGARGCFNCGGFGHQAANCPKAGTPTCLAIALTLVQAAAAMVGDSPARSATAAANPATLRAHVLRPQEATLAMEVEAEAVAIILLLVAEARRLAIPAVV